MRDGAYGKNNRSPGVNALKLRLLRIETYYYGADLRSNPIGRHDYSPQIRIEHLLIRVSLLLSVFIRNRFFPSPENFKKGFVYIENSL